MQNEQKWVGASPVSRIVKVVELVLFETKAGVDQVSPARKGSFRSG